MRTKISTLVVGMVLSSILFSCSKSFDGEYKATDLPITFSDLVIGSGGGYSEEAGYKDGVQQPVKKIFSGITLNGLNLGEHKILLNSNAVSSDGKIDTKEYGKLQLEFNSGTNSFKILVTPNQEVALRELLSE
jgi:hypothetical protein